MFVSENVCLWVLVPNVWRLENNLGQLIFSVYSVGPRTWILLINLVPKHWPGLVFKTHREDLLEESYYWTCGDNGPVSCFFRMFSRLVLTQIAVTRHQDLWSQKEEFEAELTGVHRSTSLRDYIKRTKHSLNLRASQLNIKWLNYKHLAQKHIFPL